MATSNCMCGALDCPTCGPLQGVGGEEAPALTLEETQGVPAAPSPQALAAMWAALSAVERELKAAQESPTTQEHLARAEAEYGVARSRVQAVVDELTRWGENWRELACLLNARQHRVPPSDCGEAGPDGAELNEGLGLAPERAGQPLMMTIIDGEQEDETGHWYSPTAVREMLAAERARCATRAWVHYMDVCKVRRLPPSEHEHWNAARSVRSQAIDDDPMPCGHADISDDDPGPL